MAVDQHLYTQKSLEDCGVGKVAYIRTMMSDEARKRFPDSDDLPSGVLLYALYAADGRALALTDSQGAAFGHAIGEDLKIASVH